MVARITFLSLFLSSTVVSAGLPCFAAPPGAAINFTPPLASAKTIQVTEVVWEAKNGPTPGPLQKGGTKTYRIVRPDKFRVEWRGSIPVPTWSYFVSDGKTLVSLEDGQSRSRPATRSEWPYSMMGLLNNAPGPVSAVPAIRGEKHCAYNLFTLPFRAESQLAVGWVPKALRNVSV